MCKIAESLYLCSIRSGKTVRSLRSAGKINVMGKTRQALKREVAYSYNSLGTGLKCIKGKHMRNALGLVQVEGIHTNRRL